MGSINRDLSDAKAHLHKEGWCVIPNVITDVEAKEALDRLWAVAKAAKDRGDDTFLPFLDPNESNVRVFYLLELDAIFRELIQHPTAVEMVKHVLGDNFLISNFTANIARPGSKSMGLHSDQSLVSPDPWPHVNAMNIIWCLTDVYRENGATLFIPQSNKWNSRSDIPKHAKDLLQPFEAKAGSIIVMDGKVWHTSGANVTPDQDRALLFGYYTAPHLRQQVNWTRKMSPEVQKSLSPEMFEWLGLGESANLSEAIKYLRYLDEQFDEEGEPIVAGNESDSKTVQTFKASSHK